MSALLLLLVLSAANTRAADVDFASRWADVVRYWEWSRLWHPDGLDFPDATYTPGLTIFATVFASSGKYGPIHWGFCSQSMSVCQDYHALPDGGVVHFARFMRMAPPESESEAFRRFTGNDFDSLTTRPGMQLTFPKLQLPHAVTRRVSIQAKISRSMELQSRQHACRSRIAFADESYPEVPVLVDCPGVKGVQLIRRGIDPAGKLYWFGTAGGWHPSVELYRQYLPLMMNYGEPIR